MVSDISFACLERREMSTVERTMSTNENSVTKEVNGDAEANHQIFQTDDAITIVYSDETNSKSPSSDKSGNFTPDINDSNANGSIHTSLTISEDDSHVKDDDDFPKSILTSDLARTYSTKKSVSFEQDETVTKFIKGEEIKDKKNPFRHVVDDYSDIYRNETKKIVDDFISKEEILKQSKYVPVYIRNPDRVLTYDKSVLEQLNVKPVKAARRPVPVPRKSVRKTKEVVKRTDPKYPDLSDIKVNISLN